MTVEDLIKELQQLPPRNVVLFYGGQDGVDLCEPDPRRAVVQGPRGDWVTVCSEDELQSFPPEGWERRAAVIL